jgi:hypothetical protein
MIVDLTTVKAFLQITDNSKDTLINMLIPSVQQEIFYTVKNYFKTDVSYTSNTFSFIASNNTINDSLSKFIDNNILAGTHIIENSQNNDGVVTITSSTIGIVQVSENLVNESEGNLITITRLNVPKDLEILACRMIGYTLANTYNIKSESLSKYSVEYFVNDKMISGYPSSLMSCILKYRRFYFD